MVYNIFTKIDGTTITLSAAIGVGVAGTTAVTDVKVDDNQIRVGSNVNGTLDEMWVCITPLSNSATFLGTAEVLYYL